MKFVKRIDISLIFRCVCLVATPFSTLLFDCLLLKSRREAHLTLIAADTSVPILSWRIQDGAGETLHNWFFVCLQSSHFFCAIC